MCSIKPIIVLLWYFNNAFQTQMQTQKLKKEKVYQPSTETPADIWQ